MLTMTIIDDSKEDAQNVKLAIETVLEADNIFSHFIVLNTIDEADLSNKSDIYFIDIDMPDKNGYEVSGIIYSKFPKANIVFCTNYNDLVFDAFQIEFFGFVRKDHLDNDIKRIIKKYFSRLEKEMFQLKNGTLVKLEEIMYIETGHNYISLYLADGRTIKDRTTLKSAKVQFPNSFCQISSGYIVNLKYVNKISKNQVIILNDAVLYASRAYTKKLIMTFNDYILRK